MHLGTQWTLSLLCCLLLGPHTDRAVHALRLPGVLSLIPGVGRWGRRSRDSVLQESLSLRFSQIDARVAVPAGTQAGRSSKDDGLPSAVAALDHPARATVFTQKAAKYMPRLAEDVYPELDREKVVTLGRLVAKKAWQGAAVASPAPAAPSPHALWCLMRGLIGPCMRCTGCRACLTPPNTHSRW